MISPLKWIAGRIARRYSAEGLARAVVVLAAVLLVTQLLVVWYFGSVGLSLGEMATASDDRTVVVDDADLRTFDRHYDPDREEGWCLYGGINQTHVHVADVVHADAHLQTDDRIQFTCAGETTRQVVRGRSANLIGVAHSHPSKRHSYLSRTDTMTWGRTTPVVEVMAVYTDGDGVEFFTVQSIYEPLEKEVR